MERWLTVEDDHIVVPHMPLDAFAELQLESLSSSHVSQVQPRPVRADHELGAGPLLGPSAHGILQLGAVELRHALREREVHGRASRDADLIQRQVRITTDDGSSREVNALPHQVTPNATLLALESVPDRLQGLLRFRSRGWQSRNP
jgi:hypothetical protein